MQTRFTILLLSLAAALTGVCAAQSVSIGEVTFPLGDNAFPDDVQCLSAGGCGGDYIFNTGPPYYQYIGATNALKADYKLKGVVDDLSESDDMRLNFPVPIENQPGPDIYLAQARFGGGSDLSFQDPIGLNDFGIRFDNTMVWQTVLKTAFVEDAVQQRVRARHLQGPGDGGGRRPDLRARESHRVLTLATCLAAASLESG